MEPSGSTYLYALAAVSITFIGFSALLVIFRQARGDAVTGYEGYFVLSFVQPGLIVTGGCLLPPVLGLYGTPAAAVWRACSVLVALPILGFVATLPGRRRAATAGAPMPRYVRIIASLQFLTALYLLANGAGLTGAGPGGPSGVGPYAASLTALLFTTVTAYVIALGVALRESPKTPG